jgi:hypothetical protein
VGSTNIAPTFRNIVTFQPYASVALSRQEGRTATHLIGGWFGDKTSVDIFEERKFLAASVNGTHYYPAYENDKSAGLLFAVKVI